MNTYNISPAGTLTVAADGAYLRFRADAPMSGGVMRLWLIGGGRCEALGVMSPCGGRLRLDRRISRRELARFPGRIERAVLAEQRPADAKAAPPPPAADDNNADTLWHRNPDGTLSADIDGVRCLAIPSALRRPAPCMRLICGREYVVFPAPSSCKRRENSV